MPAFCRDTANNGPCRHLRKTHMSDQQLLAAKTASDPAAIWKRYLSPPEQAALAQFMAAAAESPDLTKIADADMRLAAMREGFAQFAALLAPPLPDLPGEPFAENGVSGLWFKPESAEPDKVLLYFHGGGYMMGDPVTSAATTGFLAKEAGILCFSLDYPLGPESPFPAALDNAVAAYNLLLRKGFKPKNIVLGGDSAGGGLTLAALTLLRDRSAPLPAGGYLLSPWADLTHSFASHELNRTVDVLLRKEDLEFMAAMYAGDADRKSPGMSPAFADLRGLPPLLVQVGSYEILLDDALTIARNAALAHVPVDLTVWPGYWHVHQMTPGLFEGGRRAMQDAAAFLKAVLTGTRFRPLAQEK